MKNFLLTTAICLMALPAFAAGNVTKGDIQRLGLDQITLDGTVVTSTGAELNIMDGVTATAAELNYNDITTLGTGAASKSIVLDASGDYTFPATATIVYASGGSLTLNSGSTFDVTGTFEINNTAMTSTAAELNYLDLTTLGTGAASKAVVLDASGDYTYPATATIVYASGGSLTLNASSTFDVSGTFEIGNVAMTAGAAELNQADASAISFSSSTITGAAFPQYREFAFTSAQLNAGKVLVPAVAGQKHRVVDFKVTGDVAVTTCTGIVLEDNTDGTDYVQINLDALGTADTLKFGSAGGTISFTSAAHGGATATANRALKVDNVGGACAGANNYRVSVTTVTAP